MGRFRGVHPSPAPSLDETSHDQAVQAVLIASIGSSRDARSAGYQPNSIPTTIENTTDEATAQVSTMSDQSATCAKTKAATKPKITPTTPPSTDKATASNKNCKRMSRRLNTIFLFVEAWSRAERSSRLERFKFGRS
jgi:hypothetical protein